MTGSDSPVPRLSKISGARTSYPLEEPSERRRLPLELEVGGETEDQHQVDRPFADDLVSDRGLARPGVPCRRSVHRFAWQPDYWLQLVVRRDTWHTWLSSRRPTRTCYVPETWPTSVTSSRSTVADMAGAARAVRAHFSREFRRVFGESPHAYLLTRRLERAAALPRPQIARMADVCFSVGLQASGRSRRASGGSSAFHPTSLPRAAIRLRRTGARVPMVRSACLRTPPKQHVSRRQTPRSIASVAGPQSLFVKRAARMIKIANAQVWVHDQDEALAFYTPEARVGGA